MNVEPSCWLPVCIWEQLADLLVVNDFCQIFLRIGFKLTHATCMVDFWTKEWWHGVVCSIVCLMGVHCNPGAKAPRLCHRKVLCRCVTDCESCWDTCYYIMYAWPSGMKSRWFVLFQSSHCVWLVWMFTTVAEAGKDAGYSMFAIFGLGAAGK